MPHALNPMFTPLNAKQYLTGAPCPVPHLIMEGKMSEIKLKTNNPDHAKGILMEALETEALRLNYSLQLSKKRLSKFEKKYNVTSEVFINEWAAEDLEGKDMEYVEWAGEFKLALLLNDRLATLNSIKHVAP